MTTPIRQQSHFRELEKKTTDSSDPFALGNIALYFEQQQLLYFESEKMENLALSIVFSARSF